MSVEEGDEVGKPMGSESDGDGRKDVIKTHSKIPQIDIFSN